MGGFMSHVLAADTDRPHGPAAFNTGRYVTGRYVAAVLALWLGLVLWLSSDGAFVTALGKPPARLLAAVALPILGFLVALRRSPPFRDFVLSADIRLLTGVQAWRFAGFGFLALSAYGVLPGVFAWPAGLGDMAIGLTAPWLLLALIRRPGLAASRTFITWNLLGILDLVVAVSIGAFSARSLAGAYGGATIAPMSRLPLVLVPAYLVPVFLMAHLAALLQARRLAGSPAARP
jgi:hypothetical protein